MLNVKLAGDHLFGKLLFTWLSLVVSMVMSFVLSFFPRGVLDEILNLIESVSEGFPSYSCISELFCLCCVDILKISTYIHLMLLLYQSSEIIYPIIFSISFLRRLLDTVLRVISRPIFVSCCITVTCLLFLWTCIRHENVMRALVIYAFFLKVLTVAL